MKFLIILTITLMTLSCKAKINSESLVLTKENTLTLIGEVDPISTSKVLAQAIELDKELEDGECLVLVLNTPGGDVVAGQELIDGLRGLGRCVDTLVVFAASMGFQIAQNLDTRYVLSNGEYMSHKARGGFSGEFGGAEPSQLSNRINSWLEKIKQMDLITVKRTKGKQTLKSYQDSYENELWISGQAAVNAGYSDKVVNVKCGEGLTGTRRDDVFFMGIKLEVYYSECPLINGPVDIKMFIQTNKGLMNVNTFKQRGGQSGLVCTLSKEVLCPVDISITTEHIEKVKSEFVNKLNYKKRIVYDYKVL